MWHRSAGRFLISLTFMLQQIYVDLDELIDHNELLDDKSVLLILSRPAGLLEIEMYGGCSHNLGLIALQNPKCLVFK